MELSDSDFEDFVKKNDVCVVDFWATWCGPCRMLGPIIEEASKEAGFALGKVNVDDNKEQAVKFGVMSIPCVIFFKNGEEADRIVGNVPKAKIIETVEKIKG